MPDGAPSKLRFHPEVADDLQAISANVRQRILRAIEIRLGAAPDRYGQRLRQSLHGYWKLRVGDFRIVYEIVRREVRVVGVMDRREVYGDIMRRTARGWPPERR